MKQLFFLEFPCFFYDLADVGNFISGSSAFSEPSLYMWKWNKCGCVVIWIFFGIALLWDWNENWLFSCHEDIAEFSKFAGILSAAL